ncbi:MAG: 2Fe-2S iron-sulfur cluster-binding protein [Pseudomonadota bacterium]
MPKITVKDLQGESQVIDASSTGSLMEVLVEADYDDIEAICGGCCACATCHVYVADEWAEKLPEAADDEIMLLESVDAYDERRSRLSCQIMMNDDVEGLELEIAPPE